MMYNNYTNVHRIYLLCMRIHTHCVPLPSLYAHHMCWLMHHVRTYSIGGLYVPNCFLWLRLCASLTWVVRMAVVFLYCMYMCGWLCFNVNELGPTPTGVAVSPTGCQSLQVNWTHHAPTTPLTLNHYRVRYWPQGGSTLQSATTSSEDSYTITDLAPATMYRVRVRAETQLGNGHFCCTPTATTYNGEVSSDACRGHKLLMAACYILYVSHVTELVYSMHVMHTASVYIP